MSEEDWRQKSWFPAHLDLLGPREFDRTSFNRAFGNENIRATRLFGLMADDLDGLETAMGDLQRLHLAEGRSVMDAIDDPRNPLDLRAEWARSRQIVHHAKVFVCVMRRFWRLIETAHGQRSKYPATIRKAVRLAWRQRRAFFQTYIHPRNVIEHINENIGDGSKRIPESLSMGTLLIVDGVAANISPKAFAIALDVWEDLARAADYDAREETVRRFALAHARARLLGSMRNYAEGAGPQPEVSLEH